MAAGAGAGAAVLQRLATLNRSGTLARPLQYSQVKADLASIGEEQALNILEELADEASGVADPLEYVRNAVARVAAGARAFVAGARKRKAEAPPPGGRPGSGIVAKRVRALNGTGRLAQPIAETWAERALVSLGVGQAMAILQGLEDAGHDILDPAGYIRTAVRGAGGVVEEEEEEKEEENGGGDELEKNMEADEDRALDEQEYDAPLDAPAAGVKQEVMLKGPLAVKQELAARRLVGARAEDLSDAERIERHIAWLNRNSRLAKPIELDQVLPALDCIGWRQANHVLKRLESESAAVTDPDDYIRDLVARSGWIWAKPDAVDEDERVAKRVAWLNQFAGLQQPIDYARVADLLDGLKVAHAMVLLRELEIQAHKIKDPTEHIKRAVTLAGSDDVQVPLADENSTVAQIIAALNEGGVFAKPINFAEVGDDLERIGQDDALQLLHEVENKGKSVKDPTGYIRFKLKAKLASLGTSVLNQDAGDDTKILKRIEWLNDYGGLLQDIDYERVAPGLEAAGVDHAMTVLKELEDKRKNVREPNAFILNALKASWSRAGSVRGPAGAGAAGIKAQGSVPGDSGFKALSGFMQFLNKNCKLKKQIKFAEVAAALDRLGTSKALRVLQEMQEKGLGIDDPVAYIEAAAQRSQLPAVKAEAQEEGGDDVATLTKRLRWLNHFGGLTKKIRIDDVVGALYCLGVPQSMDILRGLQKKGRSVPDPTWFIKAAVQRANGVPVTGPGGVKEEDLAAAEDEMEAGIAQEEPEEEDMDGEIPDFEEPAGDEDDEAVDPGEAEAWLEFEAEEEPQEAGDDGELADQDMEANEAADAQGKEHTAAWRDRVVAEAAATARAQGCSATAEGKPVEKLGAKAGDAPKRVVGALTGYTKLAPTRPSYEGTPPPPAAAPADAPALPAEAPEEAEACTDDLPTPPRGAAPASKLPITPQEKLIQVRNLALKHSLRLNDLCLKSLARLPFHRAKDMIDDVVLGGRNRKGVRDPSRYLLIGCQKMTTGLGVEQGIAMELAVSLGVVLNNDGLDELACIPRRESHAIIRELSRNAEARQDPMSFIQAEVLKCRAQMDARPWPPAG